MVEIEGAATEFWWNGQEIYGVCETHHGVVSVCRNSRWIDETSTSSCRDIRKICAINIYIYLTFSVNGTTISSSFDFVYIGAV